MEIRKAEFDCEKWVAVYNHALKYTGIMPAIAKLANMYYPASLSLAWEDLTKFYGSPINT